MKINSPFSQFPAYIDQWRFPDSAQQKKEDDILKIQMQIEEA